MSPSFSFFFLSCIAMCLFRENRRLNCREQWPHVKRPPPRLSCWERGFLAIAIFFGIGDNCGGYRIEDMEGR